MRLGRTSAFVMLALLIGGILSQLPSAMADDSDNPFSALWDAIFDLQSRGDALQAQIDELRAERSALLAQTEGEPALASDLYADIEVQTLEDGRTLVQITAGNNGPDRAAAVKLTAFYLMPLFEINSIDGSLCQDKSRGIIECIIGTLEEGQESTVTIDATARESGRANTWTVDISTTTTDSDYSNNHVAYDFETGSGERIEIPQVEQPAEEEPIEEEEPQAEPEQNASEPTNSTETEEPQESAGNQTSAEPEAPSGNQTYGETVEDAGSNSTNTEAESAGNQTSADAEETVQGPDGSGTEAENENAEQPEETVPEEQPAEEPAEEQESSGDAEESAADEPPEESSEESEGADEEEESVPEEDAAESESEESESSSESGDESGEETN